MIPLTYGILKKIHDAHELVYEIETDLQTSKKKGYMHPSVNSSTVNSSQDMDAT